MEGQAGIRVVGRQEIWGRGGCRKGKSFSPPLFNSRKDLNADLYDVLQARDIVLQSDGLEQTRALASDYANKAMKAIAAFSDGKAKDALGEMCAKTLKRRK